jgi:uncharacterized protein (TIGR02246 family)
LTLWVCTLIPTAAAQENRQAESDAEIRKAVDSYVAAFNKADAKAVAELWAPEAVYSNPLSGDESVGREAIEKQFEEFFAANQGVTLEVKTLSIGFVSPNVAIEQGTAKVTVSGETPDVTEYSAVYVKHGKQWLLDRMTEEAAADSQSHYEHLKELEWMVGSWVDQDEAATVTTECQWTRNNNFLTRAFTIQVGDQLDMAGMQIIGWDPSEKQIRSWVFDSDGGFGQATWKKLGNRWHIHQSGVLPDGRKITVVNIMTYIDDNTCTLQAVNRTVDGELLPNVDEVQITKN